MTTFAEEKRKVLGPIYLEAGAALADCQSFEYGIAYQLYLLSRFGMTGLDTVRCTAILDDDEKRTAGQLIGLLKKHVKLNDGLEAALIEALQARNNLIHRFFIDNAERLADFRQHENLVKEIRVLRSKVRSCREKFDPFVAYLAKKLDGIDLKAIEEDAKAQFLRDSTEH